MPDTGNKNKKKYQKKSKNGLPVFDSDQDFLKAFEKKQGVVLKTDQEICPDNTTVNKHGVQVLNTPLEMTSSDGDKDEENFEALLDEYYKKQNAFPLKKADPVSLKKRLKRYPPVEVELDLHGLRALDAQIKVKSFIQTSKHQGFFTIRIIVGKGLHSDEGPVLPDVVEDVVRHMKSQGLVIWHEWDRKKKSKSGALIVYLKQFDQFD